MPKHILKTSKHLSQPTVNNLALMRTKTKEQLETNQGKETLKLELLETINNELVRLAHNLKLKLSN